MKRLWRGNLWTWLDPTLLRLAGRLEHLRALDISGPMNRQSRYDHVATYDGTVFLHRSAQLNNPGPAENLHIGSYSQVAGELGILATGGTLRIGHHCFVGAGTRIWALRSVVLGNYVLVAHLVDIHDSNGHSTDPSVRRDDPIDLFERGRERNWNTVEAAPVYIGDDAWIGFKSSIMKGVTIGEGAVIAAAAVVTHDVPPYTMVAGNPARVVGEITSNRDA